MHFFPTLSPSFYDTFRAFTKLDHTGSFDLSVLQADSEEKLDSIIFSWYGTATLSSNNQPFPNIDEALIQRTNANNIQQ